MSEQSTEPARPAPGTTVTKQKLVKLYDKHCFSVFGYGPDAPIAYDGAATDAAREEARAARPAAEPGKRQRRVSVQPRYKILHELPTQAEYREARRRRYTQTVESLVGDAFGEFSSLAEELREWYDNLPEAFQDGDKGQMISDAADTLEGAQEPDVPTWAAGLEVFHLPDLDADSRPDRAAEARSMIDDVVAVVTEVIENLEEDEKSHNDPRIEEGRTFIQELEEAANEVENVEFPTAFG